MNRGVPTAGTVAGLRLTSPETNFRPLSGLWGRAPEGPDMRANSSTFRILKASVQSFFPEEVLWPQGASKNYININDNSKAAYLNDYLKTENKN